MKKLIIFLIFCFIILIIGSNKQNSLDTFLKKNNLSYEDVYPYLNYSGFSLDDYFEIETIREKNNYTHLMALNKFKYQKESPAIFANTNLILVNKLFYVDKTYIPEGLVNPKIYGANVANKDVLLPKEVVFSFLEMVNDLNLYNLYIFSGYRTYEKQVALYNYYKDDNYSAKPGFSEHHTGLAIDISTLDTGLTDFFASTPEYQILIKNCYKYGFILRYPEGKESETGYFYEPWHFRYVGIKHATYIMKNNLTLERYLFENFEF
ncbi:MAG TPA: M15 family metallopeptidase [Acholeplasmataceae bacterium]|nr:M15 family metallopeptidase [Acholeplasmataceae bacterium]